MLMKWPWMKDQASAEEEQSVPEAPEPKAPVTVSAHAVKRYWERVPSSNDLTEEEVEAAVRERYARSVFVHRGVTGAHGDAVFYIDGDLVFVVKDTTMATLYPAEYGFGPEIDDTIRRKLLKSVLQMQEQVRKADAKLRAAQAAILREADTIDARIATLEAELQMYKDAKATLLAQQSKLHSEKSLLNVRLAEEADKLVMSKRYAVETLATLQAITQGARGSKGR